MMLAVTNNDVLSVLIQQKATYLLPEMFLVVGLILVLLLTVLSNQKRPVENTALMLVAFVTTLVSLGFLGATMLNASQTGAGLMNQTALYGAVVTDKFACLMRALILSGTAITILVSQVYLTRFTRVIGDFYILLLGTALGAMILVSANDLVTMFIGLETLSIPSYILAGYIRRNRVSAEAAFKYLIYGSAASALLLLGLSYLYGLSGSTSFPEILRALATLGGLQHPMIALIVVLVTVAIGFKLSLAPFHMWTPDVYDGAPTPVSAFLSTVSKTAAFALAIRVFTFLFAAQSAYWGPILLTLSIASMTVGNLIALRQTSLKRLLAYSTIAHAGYMLLGLVVGGHVGLSSLVYYLITYVFMNAGAFAVVIYINSVTGHDDIQSLGGLVRKAPGMTFLMTICLLSLAGMPITSGFFAKFFLFQALAADKGPLVFGLILFALLNSTISLFYYLRVVKRLVIDEPTDVVNALDNTTAVLPGVRSLVTAAALCVAVTMVLGVFANSVYMKAVLPAVVELPIFSAHMVSQK